MTEETGQEQQIREDKTKIRARFDEAAALILDGQKSLTAALVRGYRHGIPPSIAPYIFEQLRKVITDAEATYTAAIAQPEPKVSLKSRIEL